MLTLVLAVKMDPYCVLQSGKESVKTKRAHGMVLAWLHPYPTITHAAAQRDLLENAANGSLSSAGGGRSPNWHQTVRLELQPGDSEIAVQVCHCITSINATSEIH